MSAKPDKARKFVSVMKDSVFPRTKRCPGARRLYLLRSTQSSKDFVVLTLWDSKKDADGYGSSEAYNKNSEELLPLVTSEPSLTEYEVVVHDVNAEDLPPPKTAGLL
jgi:heme-degrading monooxygenase HmoA